MANDFAPPPAPPYGPPSNLKTIFAAWRDRGVPAAIDRAWLERIGLSGNLAPRNLHALRYLGLIDYTDAPTPLAERLRVAAEDDMAGVLERIVRTAYAKVFATRDPAVDPRSRIEDAFRHERPAAQRSRMVACFLGLCAQAGILRGAVTASARPGPIARRVGRPRTAAPAAARSTEPAPERGDAPAALALLVAKFPDFDPAWPDSIKERWFENFARLRDELR